MPFEWDIHKNLLNIQKHGLDFVDVKDMFETNSFLVMNDFRVDYGEYRYIGFGYVQNRLMCVIYTERHVDRIRIISFRKANDREKKLYQSTIQNQMAKSRSVK